jgi:putative ABC transport system substrate-binding protein
MDRRTFVAASSSGLLSVALAATPEPTRIPRIGYVSGTGSAADQGPSVQALRSGLRDLGHVEGRSYLIEYRGAEGKLDRIPGIVNELVQSRVDVIVVPIAPAIYAAKQATKTIPIVFVTGVDPVSSGLVDSLARPGGNVSGVATLVQDLNAKRLALLKEVIPRLSSVAVLWAPDDPIATANLREFEAAARALGLQLQPLQVRLENPDIDGAFQTAVANRVDALITITTASLFVQQKRIADLAVRHQLPTMFQGSTWVQSGGLMSYAADDLEALRHAAVYVDKILKGVKPADLPVEQLAKFRLVINLKTAKALGIVIPQAVMLRADALIE